MAEEEKVRGSWVELIHEHLEAVVESMVSAVRGSGSSAYAAMPLELLQESARMALRTVAADFAEGTLHHFAEHMTRTTTVRVKHGFTTDDAKLGMNTVAHALRDLFHQRVRDPAERLQVLDRLTAIVNAARDATLDAFVLSHEALVQEQLAIIRQLSSPLIPIYAGVLVLPLVGMIDAPRGELIVETLLSAVTRARASVVIIDITGVPTMDAAVAVFLTRAAQASRLLGAEVVIVGISPGIAQTMIAGQLDLRGIVTLANLEAGLELALGRRGLVIQPRAPAVAG